LNDKKGVQNKLFGKELDEVKVLSEMLIGD
jgi:hypothetical protein